MLRAAWVRPYPLTLTLSPRRGDRTHERGKQVGWRVDTRFRRNDEGLYTRSDGGRSERADTGTNAR